MTTLPITKMHSLGNDFLVLDWVQLGQALSADLIRALCDRRFGIGADQCLCLCPLDGHPVAHFGYRIFNADGSEVEQCGNGVRCLAYFVHRHYDAELDPVCFLSTTSRQWRVWREGEAQYGADLGDIAFHASHTIDLPGAKQPMQAHVATLGNPHAVFWVDQPPEHYPLDQWGAFLQTHPAFPDGVNVGLAYIDDANTVKVHVHERGVGPTLACGSNAAAVGAIGIKQGRLHTPVVVQMPGGFLQVAWSEKNDQGVCLSGSVTEVLQGTYYVPEHLRSSLIR